MSDSKLTSTLPQNELIMERFNGTERYKIKSATWNLYCDEDKKMNLCFLVESDEAFKQAEDTASFFQMLNWEVNLVQTKLEDKQLKIGFNAEIPEAYDENKGGYITNFYFVEHDGSENNTIIILDRQGDKLLAKLTGEITDVNYYDGSKSNSKIAVQAWFVKDENTMRSMC